MNFNPFRANVQYICHCGNFSTGPWHVYLSLRKFFDRPMACIFVIAEMLFTGPWQKEKTVCTAEIKTLKPLKILLLFFIFKDNIRYLISRVYTHAYISKKKSNIDTAKESKKERLRVCKREKIVVSFVSKG